LLKRMAVVEKEPHMQKNTELVLVVIIIIHAKTYRPDGGVVYHAGTGGEVCLGKFRLFYGILDVVLHQVIERLEDISFKPEVQFRPELKYISNTARQVIE